MNYRIQVQVADGQWSDLAPSGTPGAPYLFDTRADAEQTAKMCYPDHADKVRVVRKYRLTLWKRTVVHSPRITNGVLSAVSKNVYVLLNQKERDGVDGFDAAKRWAFSLGMKDEQWMAHGPDAQNLPTDFVIRNETKE